MTKVLFEHPLGLIIPLAIFGFGLAWWLYAKKGPWPPAVARLMFVLRGLVFTLIALLLLGPLLRQIANTYIKPEIIFALDTSLSVAAGTDSLQLQEVWQTLQRTSELLEQEGFQVRVQDIEGQWLESGVMPAFQASKTPLHAWLKSIEEGSKIGNLKHVVLLSDGITNLGQNPAFQLYSFPITTVGLGDTIPKKDLVLSNLRHNKVSYKGSIIPILAEITQNGFDGSQAKVEIRRKGEVLDSKVLNFGIGESFATVEFRVEAEEEGLQAYEVSIVRDPEEFTASNNSKTAFIEIVASKRQILIAGPAPHPDMKALRSMLELTESFEVTTYIHGINSWPEGVNFDLAILHQLPSRRQEANEVLSRLSEDMPRWYMYGSLSDHAAFNRENGLLRVQITAQDPDRVFPEWSDFFDRFSFEAERRAEIRNWPPIAVPFGNYQLAAEAAVLFFQRVGSVETDRPLLVIGQNAGVKTAVLIGDGLWTWRLENQRKEGKAFDELFTKLIQYLAAREDNRKFRFYALSNEFDESEMPRFESEAYNDILERLYGFEVDIMIRNEADSTFGFSYVPTEVASRYSIPSLPPGLYRYEGKAMIQGTEERERGEFLVRKLEIELNNLTANHGLLQNLANRHQGQYLPASLIGDLADALLQTDKTQKIYTEEAFQGAQRLVWPLLLLLLLISTEWFLRKYFGAY